MPPPIADRIVTAEMIVSNARFLRASQLQKECSVGGAITSRSCLISLAAAAAHICDAAVVLLVLLRLPGVVRVAGASIRAGLVVRVHVVGSADRSRKGRARN